jgi:hypothetical protein
MDRYLGKLHVSIDYSTYDYTGVRASMFIVR